MTPIARAVGVAGVLLGCLVGPAGAQSLFGPTQDPIAGARVFDAKGCRTCHAVRGTGGTVGPDLARVSRPRSFFDLAASLWNHAPRMAMRMRQRGMERPRLEPRESGDLVAYLFTLSYFDPRGSVDAGRRLFTAKGCVACHRIGGVGGTVGPALDSLKHVESPVSVAAAMWNHGPAMAQAMAAQNVVRPTFAGTELVDLITYINAASPKPRGGPVHVLPGRADEGRRLFIAKRCAECHRPGSATGGDLVEKGADLSLTQFAAAMWNKAPAMLQAMAGRPDAPPSIRPEEMADIVAYLYSMRYFARSGDPHNGARVLVNKGCLNCHGLYGERGKTAGDLSQARGVDIPGGVLSALWNHSFIADPKIAPEKAPWPTFRGDEMADLIAYLRAFRLPR